ncbi:hypothetical protein C4566_01255 [Candidatus Parcubacteria bacterium]|nr:MAG: hypothetical protein C4566_01255 [Candidatus Parcubacteria bacterium]
MMHVPPKPAPDQIHSINVGDEIVVDGNLLNHWRPARKIPADGGVAGVVIFKYQKRGRAALPTDGRRIYDGFVLFLPDGLKIGQKLRIEWRDPGCALALPIN